MTPLVRGAIAGTVGAWSLYGVEHVETLILRETPPYTSSAVARGLLRSLKLSPRATRAAGFVLRAGYGMTLGALYALARKRTRSGAWMIPLFGAAVWIAELALMPRVGATAPLKQWPRGARGLLGLHAAAFAAVTNFVLWRDRERLPAADFLSPSATVL